MLTTWHVIWRYIKNTLLKCFILIFFLSNLDFSENIIKISKDFSFSLRINSTISFSKTYETSTVL